MWLFFLSFHRKNCYLSSVITHPKICFFCHFFVIEMLELHSFVGGYVVCVPSQFNEMACRFPAHSRGRKHCMLQFSFTHHKNTIVIIFVLSTICDFVSDRLCIMSTVHLSVYKHTVKVNIMLRLVQATNSYLFVLGWLSIVSTV